MTSGRIMPVALTPALLTTVGSARASTPKYFEQSGFSCVDSAETINYFIELGEVATRADLAKRHGLL